MFNFLSNNNNGKKADNLAKNTADVGNKDATSSAVAILQQLPPESSRCVLRDRVLTSAASVYIRLGVNTTLDLDDDPDLSKEAKVKKRDEQYAAHEAYKNRLQTVLGSQTLHPILAACLVLDPENSTSSNGNESSTATTTLSRQDAFACVTLLLCNYVLLTASSTNGDKKNNNHSAAEEAMKSMGGGYDARIRNVLRMASIDCISEAMEAEDTDGALLHKLREQEAKQLQQEEISPTELDTMDNVDSSVTDGTHKASEEKLESELSDMMEAHQQIQEEQIDEKKDSSSLDEQHQQGLEKESSISPVYDNLYRQYATRKYQALEEAIADLIMAQLVNSAKNGNVSASGENGSEDTDDKNDAKSERFSRKNMVRAAKIGGVGVVAGTLLAVTGGMAAPGIAAGLAALGVGGTALTLAASPAAIMALFGLGGGGLSAYKMKRRTAGLSEFVIHGETTKATDKEETNAKEVNTRAQLHTTVCVSGWLNDEHDFQRPWGVTPDNLSHLEVLERFFSVMEPAKVKDAQELVKPLTNKSFTGGSLDTSKKVAQWNSIASELQSKYGKTPDNLLPLEGRAVLLSKDESDTVQEIVDTVLQREKPTTAETTTTTTSTKNSEQTTMDHQSDVEDAPSSGILVWDQQTEYGGDLYTVQWETVMLLRMCQVANNMAREIASKATKEVLKKTALATIMAAVAWPSLLMGLAGTLDNDWTLITIRSDIAGQELARSLLQSNEQRPVNLIGFSFGARVVFACLMELARHQEIWEKQQEEKAKGLKPKRGSTSNKDRIDYSREPASIVQDVVLMGAPLYVSRSRMRNARHMVAGRFVNCYSRKDWIISLMFQYKSTSGLFRGTCGTAPINGVGNIENYDVSRLVSSWHANYCRAVPGILKMVGFDQPMAANTQ